MLKVFKHSVHCQIKSVVVHLFQNIFSGDEHG